MLSTLALGACGVDVGGNDDLFNVVIKNNTSQTIVAKLCSNDSCSTVTSNGVLKPGQTLTNGEDPDGIVRSDQISSLSDKVLGCLPLQFSKTPPSTLLVDISQMVPCGDSGGSSAAGGHDWPFSRY
jgi:hypothetical protein